MAKNKVVEINAGKEIQKRKSWNILDIKNFQFTRKQKLAISKFKRGNNLALLGSAGTGKTLLSCYIASLALLSDIGINRIIICKSAVPTRDVGFLKGDLEEKLEIYEEPYIDTFQSLFNRRNTYYDMKDQGKIKFASTSFLRGLTFDNSIIVLDEVQNLTFHEINSVLTRLGEYSRLIITGDTRQLDLDDKKQKSGLPVFKQISKKLSSFSTIEFNKNDIVRSGFVKEWITLVEDLVV